MKKFHYELSHEDIETFLCTLTVCLNIRMDGTSDCQHLINCACCESAIEKLENCQLNMTPNELRMMSVSLNVANMILNGTLDANYEEKKLCTNYIFSINRLMPIFDDIFADAL